MSSAYYWELYMKHFLRRHTASIITILKGSIYYTWVKNKEVQQRDGENGRTNGLYERVLLDNVE